VDGKTGPDSRRACHDVEVFVFETRKNKIHPRRGSPERHIAAPLIHASADHALVVLIQPLLTMRKRVVVSSSEMCKRRVLIAVLPNCALHFVDPIRVDAADKLVLFRILHATTQRNNITQPTAQILVRHWSYRTVVQSSSNSKQRHQINTLQQYGAHTSATFRLWPLSGMKHRRHAGPTAQYTRTTHRTYVPASSCSPWTRKSPRR
jgi:hypothetical protein